MANSAFQPGDDALGIHACDRPLGPIVSRRARVGGWLSGVALIAICTAGTAQAQAVSSGFLCCNLREYKDWISDINYRFDGTRLLRAGTPVRVQASYPKYATVRLAGRELSLGNDYSRGLSEAEFLRRYVVAADPNARLAGIDDLTREAIAASRVMPGMTEEQVLMSLGYPVADYTVSTRQGHWKYWLDRSSEFGVHWDDERRVARLSGDWNVLRRVVYTPSRDIVEAMQRALNAAGMEAGTVDGLVGSRTHAAIRRYQEQQSLTRTGLIDVATLGRLGLLDAGPGTVAGASTSVSGSGPRPESTSVTVGSTEASAPSVPLRVAAPLIGPDRLSDAVGTDGPGVAGNSSQGANAKGGKLPY